MTRIGCQKHAVLAQGFAKPIKSLSIGWGFGIIQRILRRQFCQLISGVDVAGNAEETA